MSNVPEANTKFALDVFHRLTEDNPTGNILFSPVNLTSVMALVASASGPEQASEIEEVSVTKQHKLGSMADQGSLLLQLSVFILE